MSVYSKEFPILTPEANAAAIIGLRYSIDKINSVEIGLRNRIEFAAFLREAMKQANNAAWISGTYSDRWKELEAIADNLHNPPPPPLTQTQMHAILQDLNAAFGSQIGPEWTSNPFEALQSGIAHYCKVQP